VSTGVPSHREARDRAREHEEQHRQDDPDLSDRVVHPPPASAARRAHALSLARNIDGEQ
jgi:hypothetical protein